MPLIKSSKHSEKSPAMDYLRTFTTRSVSESRAGERPKASPPSPYSIPRSATSANINSAAHSNRPPLPNTDPLPTDPGALEGLLNHHASQLKKLADRVESINEWLEMDGIVLARLVAEVRYHAEKEGAENPGAIELEVGTATTPTTLSAQHRQGLSPGLSPGLSRPRTPIVHFEEPKGRKSSDAQMEIEEKVGANCNVRDVKERIKSMKRWRKELERSVFWQRTEYWRIQKTMGKERDDVDDVGRITGEDGWGVGGKTWEKASGRLPTQVEWEVMFAPERIVWDENGARPKF